MSPSPEPTLHVVLTGDAGGPQGWELQLGGRSPCDLIHGRRRPTTFAELGVLEQFLVAAGQMDRAEALGQQRARLARIAEAWRRRTEGGGA